ncbi:hypothetical protein OIU83_06465 [Flavobacterium sp. LS1R49]|uniref:Uncharacterized protein n=1 Tax=Flavobacterium shii TaxID=2987687 RepID=A0A9X2ZEY1_9FLAO|nr:hypothetical protein [Flavobacterium shii]MCV9927287.1 hypothetical protein [Flavobacterium shii]
MPKVAKFVVIILENVAWMENQAKRFYSDLFSQSKTSGEEYAAKNLSREKIFKIQNDFSVEILTVYEGETPLSFMKLNSSRLYNQNLGADKPIGIDHVIYFSQEEILTLFKRTEEIATQRKYDLIWVKALEEDTVLIKTLESLEYKEFYFKENTQEDTLQKEIYLKKEIHFQHKN